MTTYFISDVHLTGVDDPHLAVLLRFLRTQAPGADALYVLGDLFEAWIGDDDDDALVATVADAFRTLADSGVPIGFIRGNRDFLLGHGYAGRAGLTLLPDPCVIDLYGRPALLLHGDLLCTGDVAYQAFRRQSRDPAWQAALLAQPLAARRALARNARMASAEHQRGVDAAITDVDPATVDAMFARYGIALMIHGHTHRPAVHAHGGTGAAAAQRIVASDWRGNGEALACTADGAIERLVLH